MTEQDLIELYDERAAIMEFDGGMTRKHAEVAAYWDWRRVVGKDVIVPDKIRLTFLRARGRPQAEG